MSSGGLIACRTLKSLNKAHEKEINSFHSRLPPVKMPRNDEPDIVFSKRDGRDIRQPHDDPLVIMLRVEEFNIHRVLIDNLSKYHLLTFISADETGQEKDQAFHLSSGELHWG